jgi:putative resolvase
LIDGLNRRVYNSLKITTKTYGQFSKLVGKSIQTLRLWDKEGKLKPHHVTEGGHRYYSEQQIHQVLQVPFVKRDRKVIGYCRVSSNKQKDDLARQVENVKTYMIAKGYQFEIITDIGSGINYNKKGLNQLLDRITNGEVEKVVILYKDRLVRFGYELIENLCNKYRTTIEVIDNTEKTEEQELVEDLIKIVTVFSGRLPGKRANKAKKMIKELLENDTGEES